MGCRISVQTLPSHWVVTQLWRLCRLASFICGYEVFQITVRSGYGVADFKADLLSLYVKAGVKATQVRCTSPAGALEFAALRRYS